MIHWSMEARSNTNAKIITRMCLRELDHVEDLEFGPYHHQTVNVSYSCIHNWAGLLIKSLTIFVYGLTVAYYNHYILTCFNYHSVCKHPILFK